MVTALSQSAFPFFKAVLALSLKLCFLYILSILDGLLVIMPSKNCLYKEALLVPD